MGMLKFQETPSPPCCGSNGFFILLNGTISGFKSQGPTLLQRLTDVI